MPVVMGLIILIVGLVAGNAALDSRVSQTFPAPTPTTISVPTDTPTQIPTMTPLPPSKPKVYVDPDPIVNCGPGQISKQYVKDRSSKCLSYVDCGLNSNSVYILMLKTECDKKHAEENSKNTSNNYPPCTIYYPSLGYSKTYNYTSPSDCSDYKQRAINASKPLVFPTIAVNPIPTIEPYKPSQEYLDSVAKFNQVINEPFQPSQFEGPAQRCYATWEEYFNAHPNYAPQDIKGTSVNPPCD